MILEVRDKVRRPFAMYSIATIALVDTLGVGFPEYFPDEFFINPFEIEQFTTTCGSDILQNPSFENRLEGWTTNGLVTVNSDEYTQDGNHHAVLSASQGKSTVRQTIERIYSGRLYTLNFKAGTFNNLFDHIVGISFLDEFGNYVKRITIQIDYRTACCGADFYPLRPYQLRSIAPCGARTLEIFAENINGDVLMLDDMCLEETIDPSFTANEVDAGEDVFICEGNTVELDASFICLTGDCNVEWSNGETTAQISIAPNKDTVLWATLLDQNECITHDKVVIGVDRIPNLDMAITQPSCDKDNGTLAFTFEDDPDYENLEISLDGGNTYPISISDQLGTYSISNLAPGEYPVLAKWKEARMDCSIDLGVVVFVENKCASIGDRVWEDLNRNGIQDPAEQGIDNVKILLYDAMGVAIDSQFTNSIGSYKFLDIEPGDYQLQFVANGELRFSPYNVGNNNNVDSDVAGENGMTNTITLNSGENNNDFDVGLFYFCKLSKINTLDGSESGCGTYQPLPITGNDLFINDQYQPTYQWEFSFDEGATWLEIDGATNLNFAPGEIEQTLQYRRLAEIDESCPGNYSNVITKTVNESPSFEIETYSAQCAVADGEALVFQIQGDGPFGYTWDTGDTTAHIEGLPRGDYLVTVTDDNGCNQFSPVNINEVIEMTVVAHVKEARCNNSNDGSIRLEVFGENGPYQVNWVGGIAGNDLSGLSQRVYQALISDRFGCSTNIEIDMKDPNPLIMETIIEKVSCNGYEDGRVDLNVSGGTEPYNFIWSDGGSTEVRTNLVSGRYNATVVDRNGCDASQSIRVLEPKTLEGLLVADLISCNPPSNTGNVELYVEGGSPPWNFNWSNGATTQDLVDVFPGIYSVTITDQNGCEYTDSTAVIKPDCFIDSNLRSNQDLHAQEMTNDGSLLGFRVMQNTPNPFPNQTFIQFELPGEGVVDFIVRQIDGKFIHQERNYFYKGLSQFSFDGSNLSPGIYYYTIGFDNQFITNKMVVLK